MLNIEYSRKYAYLIISQGVTVSNLLVPVSDHHLLDSIDDLSFIFTFFVARDNKIWHCCLQLTKLYLIYILIDILERKKTFMRTTRTGKILTDDDG